MTRRHHQHPAWCAADHRCNLGEHRSDDIVVDLPGAGRAVLTRVQAPNGAEHAEIRMSVALPEHEQQARQRLTALLTHLRTLIGPARADRPHRSAA